MYELIPEYSEPSRKPTVLNGLEPIGVGTPFVESLSSYVSRLAASHMITPSILMKYVIAGSLKIKNHNLDRTLGTQRIIKEMDGMGIEPFDFVESLEKLTGRKGLKFLTMIPYEGHISKYDLMSPVAAWCPHCIELLRETNQKVYIPLVWRLKAIGRCDIHRIDLVKICPRCKSKSPIIVSKSVVGFCNNCNSWLGKPLTDFRRDQKPEGDCFSMRLIDRGKDFIEKNENSTFPSLLKYLICDKIKILEKLALERLLNCSELSIQSLLSGELQPTLHQVMAIAEKFDLDPMDVLNTSGAEMSSRDMAVVSSIQNPDLWSRLQDLLNDVAVGKASAMRVKDIAKVYKCTPEQIKARYPELCNGVECRFDRMMQNKTHSGNGVTLDQKVESIAEHLISLGIEPTRRRLLDIVGPKELWMLPLIYRKHSFIKEQKLIERIRNVNNYE